MDTQKQTPRKTSRLTQGVGGADAKQSVCAEQMEEQICLSGKMV